MNEEKNENGDSEISNGQESAEIQNPDSTKASVYAWIQLIIAIIGIPLFILSLMWDPSNADPSDGTPIMFVLISWYVWPWFLLVNLFILTTKRAQKMKDRTKTFVSIGSLIMLSIYAIWFAISIMESQK